MASQSPAGPPSETPSGLWTSWAEIHLAAGERYGSSAWRLAWTGWWQMSPDQLTASLK